MVKKKPYVIMSDNFKQLRLEKSLVLADQLSEKLAIVRGSELIFEPIHVRFVGKAGQCKTQYALQVMKMFKECGLIGVNRSAADSYFDGLVKEVKNMTLKKEGDLFKYHSGVKARELVDLDVLFIDEVNAKKINDPGMLTIMDGVTPMLWGPLMANPSYKGRLFKPFLWISTANHEITQHDYCIPAVLRRTHHRYVVDCGKLYKQKCYKVLDAASTFQGGFSICYGKFGRWDENSRSTSRSQTTDAENKRTISENVSTSNTKIIRIEDTFSLEKLLCPHCEEVSFSQFLEETLSQVIARLSSALDMHEQAALLMRQARPSNGMPSNEIPGSAPSSEEALIHLST
jgi:hypothetical protein